MCVPVCLSCVHLGLPPSCSHSSPVQARTELGLIAYSLRSKQMLCCFGNLGHTRQPIMGRWACLGPRAPPPSWDQASQGTALSLSLAAEGQ